LISVVVPKENIGKHTVQVTDKGDIHHLLDVFRLSVGDSVRAVDGEMEYRCVIQSVGAGALTLAIHERAPDSYSQGIEVHMALSLLKTDKMDFAVQKLTELGVAAVIPLLTKRVAVHIGDAEKERKKLERWVRIADETLKQCRGVKKTAIAPFTAIKDLDCQRYDLVIAPYEGEDKKTLKALLDGIKGVPRKILVVIGPEGGFDPGEIQFLRERSAEVVTLGKRILRAETAAIVVGGILFHAFI